MTLVFCDFALKVILNYKTENCTLGVHLEHLGLNGILITPQVNVSEWFFFENVFI